MEQAHLHTHVVSPAEARKEIWKITIILSVLTIIELIFGFYMMGVNNPGTRLTIKGVIVILMIAKAFYIVAYFMHLKHELKNMIMTIVVPLALFIWFIIAFLYDGNSFKELRTTYDAHYRDQPTIKAQSKEHHSETKQEKTNSEKRD